MRRLALLMGACLSTPATVHAQRDSGTVVFVCEHGTVKSVIALAHFQRLTRERGLPFRAISRGTAPDPRLPDFMVSRLRAEGFGVDAFLPIRFDSTALAGAIQVVSFDVPLVLAAAIPLQRWDRLPSVAADYTRGSSAIKARVEALVDSLAAALRKTSDAARPPLSRR